MWRNFPIPLKCIGMTYGSGSFAEINMDQQFEIPVGGFHVGGFGMDRKFDTHKGIDLYCSVGCNVLAVESGLIHDIRPWTGEKAGYPWWEETEAVLVKGKTGIIAYGEIEPEEDLEIGGRVCPGQKPGTVKRVLKKDKGRPMSMLHFQIYKGEPCKIGTWERLKKKPWNLIDPTPFLLETLLCKQIEDLGIVNKELRLYESRGK